MTASYKIQSAPFDHQLDGVYTKLRTPSKLTYRPLTIYLILEYSKYKYSEKPLCFANLTFSRLTSLNPFFS